MGGSDRERIGRFESLRDPQYRVLFLSGLFIFLATQAQQIARGWLAKELTGSNAGIGGVMFAFGSAMFVSSLTSGVIADRFPKRTVLMIAQSTILAGAVFIAVALELGILRYWMLVAASVLHGAGMANMGPVRLSYTTELVERRLRPNAIVLTQMSVNSTRIIGPSLAGTLIGIKTIGTGGVYVITSSLCVISIYWTARLPQIRPSASAAHVSPVTAFADGLRYVRREQHIGILIAVANAIAIIGLPYVVFLPLMASGVFGKGASGYGTMSTASAVGALSMSFWIAGHVSGNSIRRIQTCCGVVFGAGLLALSAAPTFAWALASIFVLGAMSSGYQVSNNALVSTAVDAEFQGRVQALLMVGFAVSSMASLPFGFLADHFGLRTTLVGMGAACLVVMLAGSLVPARHPRTHEARAALGDLRPTTG